MGEGRVVEEILIFGKRSETQGACHEREWQERGEIAKVSRGGVRECF